jgi:dTDP-4-amino-4,6-dideoxygalactose transaminase
MKTNNTTLSEQFQVYTATVNNSRFIQRRSTIPSLYSDGQQFKVYTATVNNSKFIQQRSTIPSLYSDGQQFHQYQHTKPPLTQSQSH